MSEKTNEVKIILEKIQLKLQDAAFTNLAILDKMNDANKNKDMKQDNNKDFYDFILKIEKDNTATMQTIAKKLRVAYLYINLEEPEQNIHVNPEKAAEEAAKEVAGAKAAEAQANAAAEAQAQEVAGEGAGAKEVSGAQAKEVSGAQANAAAEAKEVAGAQANAATEAQAKEVAGAQANASAKEMAFAAAAANATQAKETAAGVNASQAKETAEEQPNAAADIKSPFQFYSKPSNTQNSIGVQESKQSEPEESNFKNSQAIGNKLGNTSTLSNRLKKQNTHNRHNTKKNMKPQPESNQILTNPNLFPPINGKPGISV